MTATGETSETSWTELNGLPPELLSLAQRCFAADGGLPLVTDPGFLGRRWAGAGVTAFGLRDADGGLLAAGAIRGGPVSSGPASAGPAFIGLVDPAVRGRGVGSALLDRGLALARAAAHATPSAPVSHAAPSAPVSHAAPTQAAAPVSHAAPTQAAAPASPAASASHTASAVPAPPAGAVTVTVESETLSADAVELFESRGLRQTFAEDVLRLDLDEVTLPKSTWPDGAVVSTWDGSVTRRFHRTYYASFQDRPGFPGDPADEWIAENEEDDDFLPDCSLLITLPDLGDVGFVTAARGWVVQAGVVPSARRRGVAAALITESLTRMRAHRVTRTWLTVNVNNPGAAALYRRLGFLDHGCRARFRG